jgi:hypothetical protein
MGSGMRLDGATVTVVVTTKDGEEARITADRQYADLIIADAKAQPWFKDARIEEPKPPEAK